jgi:3-oxoacyl-[acyl-carrier protein] reductase
MDLTLAGKVALVTGASRGIGRGVALTLAQEGCDVMLTARDKAAVAETAAEIGKLGRKAVIEISDLREPKAADMVAAATQRAFGRLDILVNNAGATKRGDFRALSDEDWKDGFELKFFAHMRLARACWAMLAQNKGSIVNIAGVGGREPEAEFGIGSSVNAAVVAWTKALADVGKKEGVQVNAIDLGRVETDRLWKRITDKMKSSGQDEAAVRAEFQEELGITRFGTVKDVGGLIAFMASPHGRWLHGTAIVFDGGEVRSP